MLIKIGDMSDLSDTSKIIEIKKRPYILTKNDKGEPFLYNAICPHFQGTVDQLNDEKWSCPQHGWTFNPNNGKSINSPPAYLQSYPVLVKMGKLFADLPTNNNILQSDTVHSKSPRSEIKGPKISLISNACMLIEWRGTNLLTDPWIEGPAIFGSWIQYPPNEIKVSELPKIDAIWISHEHSDHLHLPSLAKFDKNIPVYLPKIENNRLAKIVKKLEFKDVISMPSFEPFNITKTIESVSFKSGSMWNDNILFLRTGEFKILNFNDAGNNLNIKKITDKADLICSVFSASASDYPTNWTHIDEITKNRLMEDRNAGMLKMLKSMVDSFQAKYFLPIASFHSLYHPDHLKHEKIKKKKSLLDVLNFFEGDDVEVLDLFPGESWNGENKKINRRSNRNKFFDDSFHYNYLKKAFARDKDKGFIPSKFDITHKELRNYFLSFNKNETIKYIGDMRLSFTAYNEKKKLHALIHFKNGNVTYNEINHPVESDLMMSCPGGIVQTIIQNNLSWDEALYWCTFRRDPDVYNLAFWRVLHAPWRFRLGKTQKGFFSKKLSNVSIATLIEKGGSGIVQILENYGLYCSGCPPSIGENLQDGCSSHGIPEDKMNELVEDIQKILSMKKIKVIKTL
jgi:CMP-N-acetylneuraminate monooxygenase